MPESNPAPAGPFLLTGRLLSRRQWLRGAGVAMALPLLEAMVPVRAAQGVEAGNQPPRRMLAICNNLGLRPDQFFPEGEGPDYQSSPYLEILSEHRRDFTVLSGVSHPDVDGSHASDVSFLTAAPHPASGGFRNSISLDQYAAMQLGPVTRFGSLTLGVNVKRGERSLSWTGTGALIPCDESAAAVYRRLFLQGSPEEVDQQIRRLELGGSIMDEVSDQAHFLRRQIGPADRQRLEEYLAAVRDVELRLATARQWEKKPKPAPPEPEPTDAADPTRYMDKVALMYRMARLAFQTDSTRLVTLLLDSANSPTISVEGADIRDGYHNLTHHGRSQQKLAQLEAIDRRHMTLLAELFTALKATTEAGGTLLDRTMVLYGSNFGDANTHVTTNMPILLAGGGFRHGHHLAFNRERNYPLPNLFVTMLQRLGLETDHFASSTGTLRGLEPLT